MIGLQMEILFLKLFERRLITASGPDTGKTEFLLRIQQTPAIRILFHRSHPDPGRESIWIFMDRRTSQHIEEEGLLGLTLGK